METHAFFKLLIQDYSSLRSSHYRRLLKKTHTGADTHANTNYGLDCLETEHMRAGSPQIARHARKSKQTCKLTLIRHHVHHRGDF